MSRRVKLEWYEVALVTSHAKLMEQNSKGRKNKHGCNFSPEESLRTLVRALAAELAVAKLINQYWNAGINTFKGADVGQDIQVRHTRSNSLIVRPPDNSNHIYYMVKGEVTNMEVVGYMYGDDAKNDKYLKAPGGRPPAYFVPREDLHSV